MIGWLQGKYIMVDRSAGAKLLFSWELESRAQGKSTSKIVSQKVWLQRSMSSSWALPTNCTFSNEHFLDHGYGVQWSDHLSRSLRKSLYPVNLTTGINWATSLVFRSLLRALNSECEYSLYYHVSQDLELDIETMIGISSRKGFNAGSSMFANIFTRVW